MLVSAENRNELGSLNDGDIIDLAVVGNSLSIRADTDEAVVQYVRFGWDGVRHTEGRAPFAMAGKAGAGYIPVDYLASPGAKTVTVDAFDGTTIVDTYTVSFTVEA